MRSGSGPGRRSRVRTPLNPTARPLTTERRQALAITWLVGTLDDQVALPIGFVCDALGLDAGAVAAAVRARATP